MASPAPNPAKRIARDDARGGIRRQPIAESRADLFWQRFRCVGCGQEFTWDADEQAFFRKKGFTHEPKHCQECQQANQQRRAGRDARKGAGT